MADIRSLSLTGGHYLHMQVVIRGGSSGRHT